MKRVQFPHDPGFQKSVRLVFEPQSGKTSLSFQGQLAVSTFGEKIGSTQSDKLKFITVQNKAERFQQNENFRSQDYEQIGKRG